MQKKIKKHKTTIQKIINKKNLEIKKLQIEIEKQKKINAQKIELISHLSHEFKTPLNAIIGFANLLKENKKPEKQNRYCENILSASKHLLHISEYTIDMARAETNKTELNYSEFCPHEIIEEILSILEKEITQKHLFIKTNLKKTMITADKRRFKQLIYNLISNAIKYNIFGGSIWINTNFHKETFFFSIKDSGIGIPDEEKHKMFEFFSNIKNKDSDITESHGIGLALCKKIINLHNGELNFHSKINKGTTFWFYIPTKSIEKEKIEIQS